MADGDPKPSGTTTPPAGDPPKDPPVTPPAKDPPKDPPAKPGEEAEGKEWFEKRVARERDKGKREAFEELGGTEDEIKEALKAKREADEAAKSHEEKLADEKLATKAEKDRNTSLLKTLTGHSDREMSGLTDEQKTAVEAIAGDDPQKRLDTITALRPSWGKPAADPPKDGDPKPAGGTPPAGTAPPPGAPKDGQPTSIVSHSQVHKDLSKSGKNPYAASKYRRDHPEIYEEKQ